jgi:hypothetical protein
VSVRFSRGIKLGVLGRPFETLATFGAPPNEEHAIDSRIGFQNRECGLTSMEPAKRGGIEMGKALGLSRSSLHDCSVLHLIDVSATRRNGTSREQTLGRGLEPAPFAHGRRLLHVRI